jgi:ribosomal-protein-alanine N-acetyltransferase
VRPFDLDDVPRVADLEARVQPRPWTVGVFTDELGAADRVYLVAEEGETLLGYTGAMVTGEDAHVTNLAVAPERRRQGVGRRLMVELIAAVVARGARHLTLEVRPGNTAARALYTSLGLAPVGVRPGYYGDDDALILWARDVDRPEYLGALG